MKQSYLALFFLTVLGLCSCRKAEDDIDIKQYDQNQIDAYIKANNLTGMQRDKAGNVDTTGIYYQILSQGKGEALDYDKQVAIVYTIKSLDGKYSVTDTIVNHSYSYLGAYAPKGLMLAIRNLAKTKGTRARFIIPSRLAYGVKGVGTGGSRLPGNETLDYYVNILDDVDKYDDVSIRKYMTANNLTGYQEIPSPQASPTNTIYRKITTAGTGTVPATKTSTLTVQYTVSLLNGTIVDQYNDQNSGNVGQTIGLENSAIQGWNQGLIGVVAGSQVSLILPSKLAYGLQARTTTNSAGATVTVEPAVSCVKFEMNILTVTN